LAYSESALGYVAFKVQSAKGTQSTGSGGTQLRVTGGQGGRLTKSVTESAEVRQDAMSTRGRHGAQQTAGSHETELSLGNIPTIMESLMRGTFSSADTVIDDETAGMSSATLSVSSNVITASGGSFITSGLRVGQIIRESEGLDSADQNKNMRITALTATALTVARIDGVDLTDAAGPISAYTFTITGRTLINPAAGALVERYYTIEEHELAIDGSEIFTDCKFTGMEFSMQPNGMFMANPSWVGTGQFETLTSGSAPLLTSPSVTTGEPMAAIDAHVRIGSSHIVDLTSFSLTLDTQPTADPVVASAYAPDVFLGAFRIGMELGMLREDLADVTAFLNETPSDLSVIIQEPETAPADFISLYVPNFTFGSVDKSPLSNAGGPRTQTISIPPALVGKDETGGAYYPTMLLFQTSLSS